jgi:hypothetical protein
VPPRMQGPPPPAGTPPEPLRTSGGVPINAQNAPIGPADLFPTGSAASQRPATAPQQGAPPPPGKPPEPLVVGRAPPGASAARDIEGNASSTPRPANSPPSENLYGLRDVRPVGPPIQGPPMGPRSEPRGTVERNPATEAALEADRIRAAATAPIENIVARPTSDVVDPNLISQGVVPPAGPTALRGPVRGPGGPAIVDPNMISQGVAPSPADIAANITRATPIPYPEGGAPGQRGAPMTESVDPFVNPYGEPRAPVGSATNYPKGSGGVPRATISKGIRTRGIPIR